MLARWGATLIPKLESLGTRLGREPEDKPIVNVLHVYLGSIVGCNAVAGPSLTQADSH